MSSGSHPLAPRAVVASVVPTIYALTAFVLAAGFVRPPVSFSRPFLLTVGVWLAVCTVAAIVVGPDRKAGRR